MSALSTPRESGAKRIFHYNWPIYAATWTSAAIAMALAGRLGPLAPLAILGGSVAIGWSLVSLVISHWIYDRSPLAAGEWIPPLVADAPIRTWAAIDAGLDGEVTLDGVLPGECAARIDLFDGKVIDAPSVARARARTPRVHSATTSLATALALADASCDLVTVIFTAHEIRNRAAREAFFRELVRVLRDGGRVLVVEHLRDLANFGAFGPGFVHFQPRREWLRLAELSSLRIASESRITPWVMALVLEKVTR